MPDYSFGDHIPPDNLKTPTGRMTEEAKAWFFQEIRTTGRNPYKVGEQIGMARSTVRRYMKEASPRWKDGADLSPMGIRNRMFEGNRDEPIGDMSPVGVGDPIVDFDELTTPAQQAYKEFGYWRTRYLGRRNILWQIQMAQLLMAWLEEAKISGERIRGVLNTPPGGGKTTTVTHDLPGWMICRDRNIRVGLGSRTTPQATAYVRRLKNTLDKNNLLNLEFGAFKPEQPEVWRQDAFIVDGVTGSAASIDYKLALAGFDFEDPVVKRRLQDPADEIHTMLLAIESVFVAGEKENTVTALSHQMGFLGGRYDFLAWDDLVDNKNSKSPDQRNDLAEWWEEYAVSRLEPGGVVALVGTRFSKYDLYRYTRDMSYTTDDDLEEQLMERLTPGMTEEQIAEIKEDLEKELLDKYGEEGMTIDSMEPDEDGLIQPKRMQRKVYRYVKYPAHNDSTCMKPTSLKQIDHIDCLLDPMRFKWHDLLRAKQANPRKYALTYQQEDESTEENLIQDVWLTGGLDADGIIYPGCYNYSRSLLEIPEHLKKPDCYSIVTVDPSALNWWSIQWWIWDAEEDKDYLIDLMRARLSADSFLSYSTKRQEYKGVVDKWQTRSVEMGWPISLWIVEQSAAQRYLFQHTWVNEWMQKTRTHIKGHETNRNKADEDFGIQTLRPLYRDGSVDLPYNQDDMKTRMVVNEFKQELVEWPDGPTEDMVMGHWFLHFNRYRIPKGLRVAEKKIRSRHPFQDTMPPRLGEQSVRERSGEEAVQGHRAIAAKRREGIRDGTDWDDN